VNLRPYPNTKRAKAPWIDKIPCHWEEKPMFAIAQEKQVKNVGMKENNLLSLSYGNIKRKDINTNEGLLPASYETYQIIDPGDIVFRLTDLQNDKRSLRTAICRERGIITSAYVVVQPDGIDPAFLNYLMRAYDVQKVFYSMGGGMRQSLGFDDLRRLPVVAPSLDEQRTIGRYLNRKIDRIDGLIEKKNRFIALMKEKRVAVIDNAVTKGLSRDVPMKNSGLDWLGEIPSHWEVAPSIWLFKESKQRALKEDEQLSATQKYGVIPLSEFERLEGRQVTKAFLNLEQRKHVEVDDFVISMRSAEGGLERAKARGCVRSSYVVLKSTEHVDVDFFTYLFKSLSYIQALRSTSSFVRDGQDLNFWNFRAVKLPLISLDEQAEIARFLTLETTRIDSLVNKTERSIELLKEKREALIAAAITGQIDVRDAA